MEKLELEHLAPYLPYGLKMFEEEWNGDGVLQGNKCKTRGLNVNNIYIRLLDSKPILRSLSDYENDKILMLGISEERFNLFKGWMALGIDLVSQLYYYEVKAFLSLHYDVFGLIEKGLAIDINSLPKEDNQQNK